MNAHLFRATGKIKLFSTGAAGVVYSPRITLNCVYGGDGGTRKLPEDGCGTEFCDRSATDAWCNGLPHRPSHVGDMLTHLTGSGYNEVIISTKSIDDLLPEAVEGIFYLKRSIASERRARTAHADFLRRYRLSAATHPLLRLDLDNLDRPFLADEPS